MVEQKGRGGRMTDLIDRQEAIIAVGDAITDGRSWYRALKEII